jgi:hypothetical protein
LLQEPEVCADPLHPTAALFAAMGELSAYRFYVSTVCRYLFSGQTLWAKKNRLKGG